MAWFFLLLAGFLETLFAYCLKHAVEKASVSNIALTVVLLLSSILTLALALRELPLHIAYPIWTGMGSVGAVLVALIFFEPQLNRMEWLGLGFLIVGMVLLGKDVH